MAAVFAWERKTMARKEHSDPIDVHVGQRVRLRRMILGISQEKLAASLGVTFLQVQKYEEGTSLISASRLQQIAQVLSVSVPYFFEGQPPELTASNEGKAGHKQREAENYILRSLETEVSRDGQHVRFTFVLADGSRNNVVVPFADLGPLILVMEEQGAKKALASITASLRGADRRFLPIRPRTVTKLGAANHEGNSILSLELDGKLAIDLSFSQEKFVQLIQRLEQVQLNSRQPSGKPS